MGLGKTLTSISVLYAFVQKKNYKGLVVCPSSLVSNWEKEFKKWLGHRLEPLSAKPGVNADNVVNTFIISQSSKYPVLILSYDV